MFIDTMQSHVEFHPNSEIRVGAKSFADLIAQLLLAPEFNTPEEMRFTIDSVIESITRVASTGKIGDGKIFVTNLEQVIRIRTGETGADAV